MCQCSGLFFRLQDRLCGVPLKLLLFLAAFAINAVAAELLPSKVMTDMAGVYKHRFMNGIIGTGKAPMEADEPYESEDIVEIVPYSDRTSTSGPSWHSITATPARSRAWPAMNRGDLFSTIPKKRTAGYPAP